MMTHSLPATTFNIVNILNDGQLHTGTDMAETLGISRTAVWKVIQRLKKYEIDIQAQHQGYQLNTPLILLEKKKIEDFLQDSRVTLDIFESILSTSYYLRDKTPLKSLHFCLSEHQSKGRGRLQRSWLSPFGRNLYFSFSYVFNKNINDLSGLSLIIGIAIANALKSLSSDFKPFLKWPNDIYINNHKVGGVLIDLVAEAYGNCEAIIGMGLNVNMKNVKLEGIDQSWTSLAHVLNGDLDRNVVVARIIHFILKGLDVFLEKGMESFLSEWEGYDLLKEQKILVSTSGMSASGIAKGINKEGSLLLELPSGKIEKFSCGDTTLLKN
jgi:BirA family biotin operon repressor/biotin-[acetyl-CoA-carboxylase] ligase